MRGTPWIVLIVTLAAGSSPWSLAQGAATSVPKGLPSDLWELLVPPDNPVTPEKVEGRDFASISRNLRDLAFHPDSSELGRFIATRQVKDLGAFKTPGLRDIALTAPYMHDGSEETLISVVEFYNRGGEPNPYLDGGITPLKLTHTEMHDLIAFMESLTGQGAGAANRPALRGPGKK
ncbi:MAG: hypothetical protein ABI672_17835 [Vicinamibacteria bacterium]